MTQDLILLGLLKTGPKHGYEIKKQISQVLGDFASIEAKSIYYPLRNLEKRGLVVKRIGRAGKRPEKYVYHLTKKGEKEFEQLLNRSFLIIQRPYFNVDISLYFLPLVRIEVARRRLISRLRGLERIKKWALNMEKNLKEKNARIHLLAIIEHNLEVIKTELRFTKKLIKTLK